MTNVVKRYQRKPDNLEAIELREHTMATAATWCGGIVNREVDRGVDAYTEILVPNIGGTKKGHVGDYLVRRTDGRFDVLKKSEFDAEYEEIGKRVEVVAPPLPATPKTPHYVARGNHPFGN